MPVRTNKDAGIGPKTDKGIRTRITYKGRNYEKTLATKELARQWRASMLVNLPKCPEGLDYKRGEWVATVDGPAGLITKSFQVFDDAFAWINKTQRQLNDGSYKLESTKDLTIDKYVDRWLAGKVRASGRTRQRYLTIIKNQISPYLGGSDWRWSQRPISEFGLLI